MRGSRCPSRDGNFGRHRARAAAAAPRAAGTIARLAALLAAAPCVAACGGADDEPACPATAGTGTLVVSAEGLPPGAEGTLVLERRGAGGSPDGGAARETVRIGASPVEVTLPGGPFTATLEPVVVADPTVRSVYTGTVTGAARLADGSVCVAPGRSSALALGFARVPTSGALWTNVRADMTNFAGFRAESLRTSATIAADVRARGGFGRDFAFDREGNAWVLGATTTDANVYRYPASAFAATGAIAPDRSLDLAGVTCLPVATALTLGPDGSLWVSVGCRGEVWRIAPEALRASGPVTAAATLRVDSPAGLAFDAAGNLWVASRRSGSMPRSLTRFDASRLGTGAEPAASLTIANGSGLPGVPAGLTATWLAFDRDGTLWVVDATAGAVARLPASALAATGEATVTADTVIFLGVLGLPEKPHLDESGGLWLAGSMGRLVRLGRDQLDTSSSPGAPTTPERVLVLGDVSYAGNVAGYPAPAGLPLVSSLP